MAREENLPLPTNLIPSIAVTPHIIVNSLLRIHPHVLCTSVTIFARTAVQSTDGVHDMLSLGLKLYRVRGIGFVVLIRRRICCFLWSRALSRLFLLLALADFVCLRRGRIERLLSRLAELFCGWHGWNK